ncbi:unnamed protein product [Protopolystoma xenopodis]|uniref:Uncharacterized protein n=1 Tax=Protopolystoma xenopodis TaxID=117903 RepID=A0A448XNC2_9PLAT|nr:unnamed protein product [Protopolystoma xenopodis]
MGIAQLAENRASSLLRTTNKKPNTERDQMIPLWHNYIVMGCCIAPSSTGVRVLEPLSVGRSSSLSVRNVKQNQMHQRSPQYCQFQPSVQQPNLQQQQHSHKYHLQKPQPHHRPE